MVGALTSNIINGTLALIMLFVRHVNVRNIPSDLFPIIVSRPIYPKSTVAGEEGREESRPSYRS